MKKINTAPLSGMQELLPADQAIFERLKQQIATTYRKHGFLAIETPLIDRQEILLAKAGGDTEKQIYKVIKTTETADDSSQALRFDHTVPLARYVVEHNNDLAFPFSTSQINRNFRGERAQRGRFREFYQCDIDVIGRDKLPVAYDAAIISCIHEALQAFQLPKMLIRLSNRKILAGFLELLNLSDKLTEISSIIDHAEKVSKASTKSALKKLDLSDNDTEKILTFANTSGDYQTIYGRLSQILNQDLAALPQNSSLKIGLGELHTVYEQLLLSIAPANLTIDLMIIRGLDYYTGTVYEVFLKDHREIGSISSGGRYENLASNFTDQKFPGVGGSIGLTRLFYILREHNLLTIEQNQKALDYVLLPLDDAAFAFSQKLASKLRNEGKTVDIDYSDRKLSARFNRAAKIASYGVVIGGDEVRTASATAKNLESGELRELTLA